MKSVKIPLSLAILSASVSAQAVEPQGIELDSGITLLPSVELSVEDNDNVYLQPDETKEASTITRLSPALNLAADLGQTQLDLGLSAEKGVYSSDEDDNYTDTRIRAGAQFEMTSKHALALSASLNSLHDARGAGTTEGSAALEIKDPDEYDESVWDAAFTYGSEGALLNMTFGMNRYEKEYQNNLNVAATDNRDHVKTTFSADTAVYISDRSNFLLDLSHADIDYSEDNIITQAREGSLSKALVGMSYDISGKLTSSAKVGVAQRSFESDDVDTDSAASWEVTAVWTPRTYSEITLYTSQSSNEASSVGNYIDTKYSMLSWEHSFSEFFSLTADVSMASDSYYNEASDREDDTLSYGLKGTYSPMTSMDLYGSFKQAERDSSTAGLDYDQQVVSFGLILAI
jgi:hypothetical protein